MDPLASALEVADGLTTILIFIVPSIHLLVAPFTKVEESFALQAAHDILVYGPPSDDIAARLAATFDHFTFPGAVPRTFAGPALLAALSQPIIKRVGFWRAQLVVRGCLGFLNASSLLFFRRALSQAFGRDVARIWLLLLVTQFHIMYYLARTLPNMFAFGLTTVAAACLLPKSSPQETARRQRHAIAILVFAGAVFRSEIAILASFVGLQLLIKHQIEPLTLAGWTCGSLFAAIGLTAPLDSYFWQLPIWPELSAFLYNVIKGSSSNWGVSPWHYYFTSALPRLMLNPLAIPLILFALFHPSLGPQARTLALPNILYVAAYSLLPHKETRFIFYVVPALTAVAAMGAHFIFARWSKGPFYKLGSLALAGSIVASFSASFLMLSYSAMSYPGGSALQPLYIDAFSQGLRSGRVYADTLTCSTGLTLFGANPFGAPVALGDPVDFGVPPPAFTFDRTEDKNIKSDPAFWDQFDYVLIEDVTEMGQTSEWMPVEKVYSVDGIAWLEPGREPVDAETQRAKNGDDPLELFTDNLKTIRDFARKYTGGWWPGIRFTPKIHILRNAKLHDRSSETRPEAKG